MTADVIPAVPDPPAVREALEWFREGAGEIEQRIRVSGEAARHAATVVRAALARDVPAGRDLTAQDAAVALAIVDPRKPQHESAADYLNRVARPAGEVPAPTDEPTEMSTTSGGPVVTWEYLTAAPTDEPDGSALIAAERRRQVETEGWTPEHDAGHRPGDLARAAVCYATPPAVRQYQRVPEFGSTGDRGDRFTSSPIGWPWAERYWKPRPDDRVRELVKAGALVAAEIDRLSGHSPSAAVSDRAGTAPTGEPPAGLPAVLASVDDVAKVCSAAGLGHGVPGLPFRWIDDVVAVSTRSDDVETVSALAEVAVRLHVRPWTKPVVMIYPEAPGTALYAAIQAARSAS